MSSFRFNIWVNQQHHFLIRVNQKSMEIVTGDLIYFHNDSDGSELEGCAYLVIDNYQEAAKRMGLKNGEFFDRGTGYYAPIPYNPGLNGVFTKFVIKYRGKWLFVPGVSSMEGTHKITGKELIIGRISYYPDEADMRFCRRICPEFVGEC